MRNYTNRIISMILLILFTLSTTLSIPALAAEGRTAKIYDYSNEVTVTRGKADLKAFKGMRLKEGDTIKTGKSSNAYIEIDSDKVIKLDASTIITISNMSGTDKNGSINISLSSGKIYNDIKKKLTKNSTYKVRTPNAVMGVRGTTFVINLKSLKGNTSDTVLTVFDGTVAFAPSEQEDLNTFVGMNQTANTADLSEGEKPIVTQLDSKDLSTFELTEIMKDPELQQNINELLKEENKTLEEVLKQAEEREEELNNQQEENQNPESTENPIDSNPDTNDSSNTNENDNTNHGSNGKGHNNGHNNGSDNGQNNGSDSGENSGSDSGQNSGSNNGSNNGPDNWFNEHNISN